MARWKLTSEILENIEVYAEDHYTLEELFDELNISSKLMKDEQVIQAFEKGLNRRKDAEELATKQFSSPMHRGMVNILEQNGKDMPPISQQVLHDDIVKIINEVQSGDSKALLTMLTTNIMQLQLFNGTVTRNLMGEAGKQLDNFTKLSNMQLKVMQETRKSIMAINEITNPKRTTFIKEANQHNHLHQNSEKKDENENEKRIEYKEVTEAEVYEAKETVHENK
ncbi:hypothetical protein TSL6_10500 [Sulfurovum sp. TSL6]|uniref:hypothetical protein n=1 Tax=Sulfurovum sp. TSL6 TaxID=2826995 RepID=UPI001CC44CF1|nr:hypothetical protein [Sulfurovum sp. TSL6]GIU00544.1 hypothetical protein TSL6_10500 [Sulfurovum sp. TSL6]